jgi:hypothetical protein
MSAANNLRAARALIEDPKHWTQGSYGLDSSGHGVSTRRINEAVCFCSWGALVRVGIDVIGGRSAEERYLDMGMGNRGVGNFNDTHTHAEVLAAFDKAIELAEKQ